MKRQRYDTFTIGQHVALIKPLTSVAEIKKKDYYLYYSDCKGKDKRVYGTYLKMVNF